MVRLMGRKRSDYLYDLIELTADAAHMLHDITHDSPCTPTRLVDTLSHATHTLEHILTTAMHMHICDDVLNDALRRGEEDEYDSDRNRCLDLTRQDVREEKESEGTWDRREQGKSRERREQERESEVDRRKRKRERRDGLTPTDRGQDITNDRNRKARIGSGGHRNVCCRMAATTQKLEKVEISKLKSEKDIADWGDRLMDTLQDYGSSGAAMTRIRKAMENAARGAKRVQKKLRDYAKNDEVPATAAFTTPDGREFAAEGVCEFHEGEAADGSMFFGAPILQIIGALMEESRTPQRRVQLGLHTEATGRASSCWKCGTQR